MQDTTNKPADLSGLRASRKADRAKIAAEYRRIAEQLGATVEERETEAHPGYSGAGIDLNFSLGGVGASVSIDDSHEQHGTKGGLISWFNDYAPGAWQARRDAGLQGARDFASGFNAAVGEHGGRSHHKATSCGAWAVLAVRLQAGLRHAASGTAFMADAQQESGQ